MFTLEELKEKTEKEYKGFNLKSIKLDGEYVSKFTLSRLIDNDVFLNCYFWDNEFNSYIAYFV